MCWWSTVKNDQKLCLKQRKLIFGGKTMVHLPESLTVLLKRWYIYLKDLEMQTCWEGSSSGEHTCVQTVNVIAVLCLLDVSLMYISVKKGSSSTTMNVPSTCSVNLTKVLVAGSWQTKGHGVNKVVGSSSEVPEQNLMGGKSVVELKNVCILSSECLSYTHILDLSTPNIFHHHWYDY